MKSFSAMLAIATLCFIINGCGADSANTSNDRPFEPATQSSQNPQSGTGGKSPVTFASKTPRDAIQNFYEGLADGNEEQARAATVTDDRVLRYIGSTISLLKEMDAFAQADNEHFGADGAMPVGLMRKQLLASIDSASIEMIDDTHARYTFQPDHPMILEKFVDGWKIDFTGPKNEQFLTLSAEAFDATASVFREVRRGILEQEITSREDARKQMSRMMEDQDLE